MINFFRRIRRRLADDNQFFKYSRYAIGEILLVVVGILIALQINTWNEERKLAKTEKSYYRNLYNDLQRDSTEYLYKGRNARDNIVKLENILSFIENNYELKGADIKDVQWINQTYKDTLALVHCLSQAGFFQYPQLFENTIIDLRSTGNLKLLQNKSLKNDLLYYYNHIKLWESWIATLQPARTSIENTLNGILDKDLRTAYTTIQGLNGLNYDFPALVQKMKNKPELKDQIIGMYHIQSRIAMRCRVTNKTLTSIMSELKKEMASE